MKLYRTTLMEMLGIFGIIAVLAAVITPVVAQAREQGRRTPSLTKLMRMGAAEMMYAQDYDGTDSCAAVDPTGEWQSAEGGCKDSATHLVWSGSARQTLGHGLTYPQAQAYCSDLNTTSGYTGWGVASLAQHQAAYANHGANYINNPTLYISWTSTTYPGTGKDKGLTYDKAFDWSNDAQTSILIQNKYGTYSYADVLCVRQGL